jgi:hypothetical protein
MAGRELLQCRMCRRQTSVTAGTALHRTHVPLRLWLAAAYLVTTHTPGFSVLLPRVHRTFSNLKTWLEGTRYGVISNPAEWCRLAPSGRGGEPWRRWSWRDT